MILRPYQIKALNETRANLRQGALRNLLVSPTGSGKGTIASEIIRGAGEHKSTIGFWVNRRELVKDMSRRLDKLNVEHGVMMANHPRRRAWLPVQVASIETLRRAPIKPKFDVIIADECHFAISDGWLDMFAQYPDSAIVGMTATPIRADGKGLGRFFERMVLGPSVQTLINEGNLVPTRVFAPSAPDLHGVKKGTSDYNRKQLATVCNKPQLVGDIVQHWLSLARGRPTVCFGIDKAHAQKICDQFLAAGVRAEYADCDTPSGVRDKLWDDLGNYAVEVVCSVGIVSYGWDCPPCSCAILARPTESLALFLQQCGRILRPHQGKEYALILDHAGNTLKHGFVEDDREWSLADGYVEKDKEKGEIGVRICKTCFIAFPVSQPKCPNGHLYQGQGRQVEHVKGELQEMAPVRYWKCGWCNRSGRLAENQDYSIPCPACGHGPVFPLASKFDRGENEAGRKERYVGWVREAKERGYKPGWAAMRFNQTFGRWPKKEWKETAEAQMGFDALVEEAV